MLEQNTGVKRHVIDALFRLVLDHVEQVVGSELLELFVPLAIGSTLHRLVNRNGTDWNWRSGDDGATDSVDVAAGGQVHHGISTVFDCDLKLFDLAIHVGRDLRVSDVGVDLDARNFTDRHWLERAREMVNVRGNDQSSDRNLVAHRIR